MSEIHLGISYGHNATVAVVKNGELIFCLSEERINRIKNSTGFPRKTIKYIYENICSPLEIKSATLFEESVFGYIHLKGYNFEPYQFGEFLSPEVEKKGAVRRLLRGPVRNLMRSNLVWQIDRFRASRTDTNTSLRHEAREHFCKELSLSDNKVFEINHHLAHAYSALANIYSWPIALIFTLDGVGDGLCATVNTYQNGKLVRISEDGYENSLGQYYAAITALMGMKAGEHEFKVMGLAPYAKSEYYRQLLESLEKLLTIDSEGAWQSVVNPYQLKHVLEKHIRGHRFDNIAGAIQELAERLVQRWVDFWIAKTGVANIALAGGVFMNVKVCQKLAANPNVERIFVVPSAADESTAIGCAFWGAKSFNTETVLQPIDDLYLGMEFSDQQVEHVLSIMGAYDRYKITRPENINGEVAHLLMKNKVVARCTGRMEFGARALGNRSILANPCHFDNIELINSAIKSRDFWMPFTPSILEEDMSRYIVGHERIFAPYMCITFDTTQVAREHLKAAIHPRDRTARPQCVVKNMNPDYHELISIFKSLTGVGAVLNTSFNLHGEPNVCSPIDALHVLDNSGLEYLALGPFLLEKKSQ